MAKFKEVMTTENLSDYLDQHARMDVHNRLVYFGCPYCTQEELNDLDLEFGTLIFNPETHDIMCSSRPNSNHEDTHAIKLEEGMVKHYLQNMDYEDYLEAKFQNELKKSRGGNNELL